MTWSTKNLPEHFDYPIHLLRQIYYRVKKARLIILLLVVFVLVFYFAVFRQVDRIEFYQKYHAEVQFAKKLTNIFYLPLMLSAPKLERYDLVVHEKDLEFLNRNLPELYAGKMLTEQYKQSVKAKFVFNGKEYDVKARYRGLMDNHWRDLQKSWLVTFKPKTGNFENQRQIHLIIASDRHYIMEEFNFYRARKLGLVVPETKFVDLFVNGERQGVYWQLEDWDNTMLTRRNLSGNLYGSNDLKAMTDNAKNVFNSTGYWEDYSGTNNFSDLEALLEVINNPSDDYFNQKIGQIIDLDNFYKWQIIHLLADSTHQTNGLNIKMYFDSDKRKFVLLPSDVGIGEAPPQFCEYNYDQLVTRILKNPVFLQERNKKLWEYVSDDKNLEDDLRQYDQLDRLTKGDIYKDFKKVDSDLSYRRQINNLREQIKSKFLFWRENLKSTQASLELTFADSMATVKITSNGFSSVDVSNIKAMLGNCGLKIYVYQDVNNGSYDQSDRRLGELVCRDGIYELNPQLTVSAVKDDSDGHFLKPGVNSSSIFLVAQDSGSAKVFTKDNLLVELKNSITGEVLSDFPVNFISNN